PSTTLVPLFKWSTMMGFPMPSPNTCNWPFTRKLVEDCTRRDSSASSVSRARAGRPRRPRRADRELPLRKRLNQDRVMGSMLHEGEETIAPRGAYSSERPAVRTTIARTPGGNTPIEQPDLRAEGGRTPLAGSSSEDHPRVDLDRLGGEEDRHRGLEEAVAHQTGRARLGAQVG